MLQLQFGVDDLIASHTFFVILRIADIYNVLEIYTLSHSVLPKVGCTVSGFDLFTSIVSEEKSRVL